MHQMFALNDLIWILYQFCVLGLTNLLKNAVPPTGEDLPLVVKAFSSDGSVAGKSSIIGSDKTE